MIDVTGKRLAKLREQKGWTKTYTAKKLGINTLSTYANWEYGIRQINNEMLVNIALLFDVTTDYLLGISDTPNNKKDNDRQGLNKSLRTVDNS